MMAQAAQQDHFRDIGPGDNAIIWGQLLPKNALFTNFCLASLNHGVFRPELADLNVFPYAYVYAKLKSGNNRTPRHDIHIAIIGEFLAPHIPMADIKVREGEARGFFIDVIKRAAGMEENPVLHQAFPDIATEEEVVAQLGSPDVTFEQAYHLLTFLGARYAATDANVGVRVLLGMVTGILKRGSMSDVPYPDGRSYEK